MTTDDARRGILWMVATALLFALTDVGAKWLSETYPLMQIVWARFTFNIAVLCIVFAHRLGRIVRSRRLGLQLLRSVLIVTTVGCFFLSLRYLPVVTASSVLFLSPVFLTVLATPMLGEKVGLRRWISVVAAFAGALIIVRPGTEAFHPAILLPLFAALMSALHQVLTRQLAAVDGPLTSLFYSALVGVVVSSVAAPAVWVTPDLPGWSVLLAIGVFGGAAQLCLIQALTAAQASLVAPYHYTHLLWSAIFGFLVFGHVPDGQTLAGAAVIVASGLYILHREHLERRVETPG